MLRLPGCYVSVRPDEVFFGPGHEPAHAPWFVQLWWFWNPRHWRCYVARINRNPVRVAMFGPLKVQIYVRGRG